MVSSNVFQQQTANKHCVIIGMPAAGKTHLGRKIAQDMKRRFCDSDRVIEQQEGLSIPEMFLQKGEAFFRDCEKKYIAALLQDPTPMVIALGGGAFFFPETQKNCQKYSCIIWIDAPDQTLCQRIMKNPTRRPLFADLQGKAAIMDKLKALRTQRTPHYQKADYILPDSSSIKNPNQWMSALRPLPVIV